MLQSIMEGTEAYHKYVRDFMSIQFPAGDVPLWVVDALATADIHIETTLTAAAAEEDPTTSSGAVTGGEPSASSAAVAGVGEQMQVHVQAPTVAGGSAQSGYKRKLDSAAGEV